MSDGVFLGNQMKYKLNIVDEQQCMTHYYIRLNSLAPGDVYKRR